MRTAFAVSLVYNLGQLAFFKYAGFFVANASALFGAGMRIETWHGVDAEVLWAFALRDASDTQKGDSLINFLISYGF